MREVIHCCLLGVLLPTLAWAQGTSLRFDNDSNADADLIQRVRIVVGDLSQPTDLQVPIDVGDPSDSVDGSFTLEFWLRASAPENPAGSGCGSGATDWIDCNITLDRDVNGSPDFGDFGLSVCSDGGVRAGIENGSGGVGVCSSGIDVLDSAWHHVAWTRDGTTGQVCLFVDGVEGECASGPLGSVSFDDTSTGSSQDPTLVLAAEKHGFPDRGFTGWLDEFRASRVVRYAPCGAGNVCFAPPLAAFVPDPDTVGLYHFDDGAPGSDCSCAGPLSPLSGAGSCVADSSGLAQHGECRFGSNGSVFGPTFASPTPFGQDADGDGVPDATDNCPHLPNTDQTDRGGLKSTAPDGIGDGCQCGDVSDNGRINLADVGMYNQWLASGKTVLPTRRFDPAKCNVSGVPECNLADVGRLNLELARSDAVPQVCVPALPPPAP